MSKLVLKVDTEAVEACMRKAMEFFCSLESESLHDADLEKCISAFYVASNIYHKEWFSLLVLDD